MGWGLRGDAEGISPSPLKRELGEPLVPEGGWGTPTAFGGG